MKEVIIKLRGSRWYQIKTEVILHQNKQKSEKLFLHPRGPFLGGRSLVYCTTMWNKHLESFLRAIYSNTDKMRPGRWRVEGPELYQYVKFAPHHCLMELAAPIIFLICKHFYQISVENTWNFSTLCFSKISPTPNVHVTLFGRSTLKMIETFEVPVFIETIKSCNFFVHHLSSDVTNSRPRSVINCKIFLKGQNNSVQVFPHVDVCTRASKSCIRTRKTDLHRSFFAQAPTFMVFVFPPLSF